MEENGEELGNLVNLIDKAVDENAKTEEKEEEEEKHDKIQADNVSEKKSESAKSIENIFSDTIEEMDPF